MGVLFSKIATDECFIKRRIFDGCCHLQAKPPRTKSLVVVMDIDQMGLAINNF